SPVDPYTPLVGHFFRHRAALDETGDFQKLVEPHYFTASLSLLPALKAGTFDSGIVSVSPVCGLRPTRAERLRVSNVPKPINCTFSPADRASVTSPMK